MTYYERNKEACKERVKKYYQSLSKEKRKLYKQKWKTSIKGREYVALGHVGERIEVLQEMIRYLRRHKN